MRIEGLVCAACVWVTGCAYEYRPSEGKPERDIVPTRTELNRDVSRALSGHGEIAREYYGLYETLSLCVENPKYPWKIPREIEEDVVRAREILELKHGEYPEFTRVVAEHLAPLKENRELSEELRREWSRRLRELAEACKEAALKERER